MARLNAHYDLIARHIDLFERVYAERNYEGGDDDWRALTQMTQAGIMVEDEGVYSLSLRDRTYADDVSDRTRAYASGTLVADLIDGLIKLVADMRAAAQAGNETGRADIEDEAIDRLRAIPQEITRQLRVFDTEIRNGFHDARTLEERERRNAFYLDKATRINDAITYLNSDAALALVSGTVCLHLRRVFQRQIKDRINSWSSLTSDLIEEMKAYLHKTKEVAAQTKRMRAILAALKTVSAAEQIEVLALADKTFHPMKVSCDLRPDFRSADNEDAIVAATAKLDPARTRSARRAKHDAAPIRHDAPVISADAGDVVPPEVVEMLAEVRESRQPVSAMTWARQRGLPRAMLFTLMVHDHVRGLPEDGRDIALDILPPPTRFSTPQVEDVIVSLKAA